MPPDLLKSVLLPLALIILMFGMGMTLWLADFKRVVLSPKATLVGLASQLLNGESTPATRWASPTQWSYGWVAPRAGSWRIGARARDHGGRADPTPAWVNVTTS